MKAIISCLILFVDTLIWVEVVATLSNISGVILRKSVDVTKDKRRSPYTYLSSSYKERKERSIKSIVFKSFRQMVGEMPKTNMCKIMNLFLNGGGSCLLAMCIIQCMDIIKVHIMWCPRSSNNVEKSMFTYEGFGTFVM